MISKDDVLAELQYELGQRHRVYTNLVAKGKMTEEAKALKIAKMERAIELVKAAPEEVTTLVHVPNLTYEARQVWDQQYQEDIGMPYSWPKERGGGREMKGLKQLCERLRHAVAKRNNRQEPDVSDEEVLQALAFLLKHLPDWYKTNTYTPHQIYDQFNAISAAIKKQFNRGNAGAGAPASQGFTPE